MAPKQKKVIPTKAQPFVDNSENAGKEAGRNTTAPYTFGDASQFQALYGDLHEEEVPYPGTTTAGSSSAAVAAIKNGASTSNTTSSLFNDDDDDDDLETQPLKGANDTSSSSKGPRPQKQYDPTARHDNDDHDNDAAATEEDLLVTEGKGKGAKKTTQSLVPVSQALTPEENRARNKAIVQLLGVCLTGYLAYEGAKPFYGEGGVEFIKDLYQIIYDLSGWKIYDAVGDDQYNKIEEVLVWGGLVPNIFFNAYCLLEAVKIVGREPLEYWRTARETKSIPKLFLYTIHELSYLFILGYFTKAATNVFYKYTEDLTSPTRDNPISEQEEDVANLVNTAANLAGMYAVLMAFPLFWDFVQRLFCAENKQDARLRERATNFERLYNGNRGPADFYLQVLNRAVPAKTGAVGESLLNIDYDPDQVGSFVWQQVYAGFFVGVGGLLAVYGFAIGGLLDAGKWLSFYKDADGNSSDSIAATGDVDYREWVYNISTLVASVALVAYVMIDYYLKSAQPTVTKLLGGHRPLWNYINWGQLCTAVTCGTSVPFFNPNFLSEFSLRARPEGISGKITTKWHNLPSPLSFISYPTWPQLLTDVALPVASIPKGFLNPALFNTECFDDQKLAFYLNVMLLAVCFFSFATAADMAMKTLYHPADDYNAAEGNKDWGYIMAIAAMCFTGVFNFATGCRLIPNTIAYYREATGDKRYLEMQVRVDKFNEKIELYGKEITPKPVFTRVWNSLVCGTSNNNNNNNKYDTDNSNNNNNNNNGSATKGCCPIVTKCFGV